jgi:hypothetical protein
VKQVLDLEGEIMSLKVPPNAHTRANVHTRTHTQHFLQGDREERASLKRQITDLSRDNGHLRNDITSLREDVTKRQKHEQQEVEQGKSASMSNVFERLLTKQMESQSSAAAVIDAVSNVVVAAAGRENNKSNVDVVPLVGSESLALRSGLQKLGNPSMKDMVATCTKEILASEMHAEKLTFGERSAVGAAFLAAKATASVV